MQDFIVNDMGNVGTYIVAGLVAFIFMGGSNHNESAYAKEIHHIDSMRTATVQKVPILERKTDSIELVRAGVIDINVEN